MALPRPPSSEPGDGRYPFIHLTLRSTFSVFCERTIIQLSVFTYVVTGRFSPARWVCRDPTQGPRVDWTLLIGKAGDATYWSLIPP